LKKNGKRPYLVPVDVYRPAAIDQLKKLGSQLDLPVFQSTQDMKPLDICLAAEKRAREEGYDTLLVDTAGRLHMDEELMAELVGLKTGLNPSEILLVADAMTGQDAVNIASSFDKALDLSGVILTKMDGDARGGAALSIKAVTGKPLKFIGVGEKSTALEPFHPERMASRILGMGDTLSFIERAQDAVDQKKAEKLEQKLKKNQFTLEDFRDQMASVRKMGSIKELIGLLPGVNKKMLSGLNIDEREFVRIEAIINSMTPEERRTHAMIKGSRKKRIARGSGTTVQDVNKLLKSYTQTMKMVKKINKGGMRSLRGMLPF
jgi:signal recognition particle subunit SRP54